MRECEYLHPIDKLERISRDDLCKRFDEVLDKVDKDDIGYVITDAGKKDMVLCTARWFLFQLDDDFGCVINSALRYAIGRHTYMPGVVCNFVRKYLDILDAKTIEVMIEDITTELKFGIDREELWVGLRDELIDRRKDMS